MDKKYVILDTEDLNEHILKFCISKTKEHQRYSLDGKKVVIKLEGIKPPALDNYQALTAKEVRYFMSGPEWNPHYEEASSAWEKFQKWRRGLHT